MYERRIGIELEWIKENSDNEVPTDPKLHQFGSIDYWQSLWIDFGLGAVFLLEVVVLLVCIAALLQY